MSNLARKIRREDFGLEGGTVVRLRGDAVVVSVAGRELEAARAVMCLIEPEVGDRVMVASSSSESYVLGVLGREAGRAARMSVAGDLELHLAEGRFAVSAQKGVDLTTAAEARVTAARFTLHALDAELVLERLRLLGTLVEGEVQKVRLAAESVETVVERVWERVKRCYRFVEELDQLRAEHIDHRAKRTARLHAENAVITADGLAKIDGDQVHIG
jgi:hypothetical protein